MADEKVEGLTPQSDPSLSLDADVPGELLADPDLVGPEGYQVSADENEAEELAESTDVPAADADVVDDEAQLEEAEAVAALAASSRPVRKAAAVVKKDHPTPKQAVKRRSEVKRRTTPVQFARESAAELRKVVWPSGSQLRQYFVVVLLFVLIIIAYVSGLDLLIGQALLRLLGE